MKADVHSLEKKALQWATEYFRGVAADLTPDGSKRRLQENTVKHLLECHERDKEGWDDDPDHVGLWVSAARKGIGEIGPAELCNFAAILLERGEPLPTSLKKFVVDFLRTPNGKKRQGRDFYVLKHRNLQIALVVHRLAKKGKFPPTRNEATDSASAASIVRDALEIGAGVNLTEANVCKIWRGFRPFFDAMDPI